MSKSDQNARVSTNTNETNNQNVTSLTIIPKQKEKDDKVVTSKSKQRENIRYY